jgi:serine/threonine protein kinase
MEKLNFIDSDVVLRRILKYANRRPPNFASYFPPNTAPLALDLLYRMLQFHPDDRITVEDALCHPYLKDFHGQLPEPDSETLFNFDFETGPNGMDANMSRFEVRFTFFFIFLTCADICCLVHRFKGACSRSYNFTVRVQVMEVRCRILNPMMMRYWKEGLRMIISNRHCLLCAGYDYCP